jgi:MFS family permease
MYSESDLQSAVSAGVLPAEAADALRAHVTGMRSSPAADEEHFRLVTGFNDIFVTIAAIILLVAVAGIGQSISNALAGVFVAAAAWGLAEFFTLKRRMALPSIVLLLAFTGGVAAAQIAGIESSFGDDLEGRAGTLMVGGVALITAFATWLHWRRFHVPITVAAGTAAIAATVVALILAAVNPADDAREQTAMAIVLIAGLAVFAVAMRWDISDRARETRRSDVAFWLHLLAAPMIAHPLFWILGVTQGDAIGAGAAFGVVAVYIGMGHRPASIVGVGLGLCAGGADLPVPRIWGGRVECRTNSVGYWFGTAVTLGLLEPDTALCGRKATERVTGQAAGDTFGDGVIPLL